MKKILAAAAFILSAQSSFAAITMDFDCRFDDGTRIYWETQPANWENPDAGGNLYRGHLRVEVTGTQLNIVPNQVSASAHLPLLLARTQDGQIIRVNATQLIKDDGDERTYSGVAGLKVKSPTGQWIRKPTSRVTCKTMGEA